MSAADQGSLYEKGRRIIWVIEIKGKSIRLDANVVEHQTGFSLERHGSSVIITCARFFYFTYVTSVRARGFDGTFKTAKVKLINHKLNLAMLEIDDDDQVTNEYGELVLDGSLSACQQLVCIGNPGNYVGSSFVGRACFPCENLPFDINKYKACGQYKSRKIGCPIKRMVLGDLIQEKNFIERFEQYDEKLNAYVPIIQCDGFPWLMGFSGSPVFNLDGKIVGMLFSYMGGFSVAIHVAAIRAFLNSNPPNEGSSKGTSKRIKISR